MDKFIQIHALTFYPSSNLNRDDLGKPKTAIIGNATRLRISSQCLKRAWRTSDLFQKDLKDNLGKRTRYFEDYIFEFCKENGIEDKKAKELSQKIVNEVFYKKKEDKKGSNKSESPDKEATTENETKKIEEKSKQIIFVSPDEELKIK